MTAPTAATVMHTLWAMPVRAGTPAYERLYPAVHTWLARAAIDADAQPARSRIEIVMCDDDEVYLRAWRSTGRGCPTCPDCPGAEPVLARMTGFPPDYVLRTYPITESLWSLLTAIMFGGTNAQ